MSNVSYKLVKARHGQFLVNPRDVYIGTSMIAYGEFSEIETKILLQLCRAGATVVEVGANIGSHTIPLAKKVGPSGRVIAIEPQPVIFQNLCANIALNNLGHVETLQKAFGAMVSSAWMPRLDYGSKGNFGGISVVTDPVDDKPYFKIDVARIDDLELKSLDLLKIDVEGMELDVLRGAEDTIAAQRPIIYLENDRREKSPDLILYLWKTGYKLWWHTPALFNLENYNKNHENMWPGIISLNMLCLPGEMPVKVSGMVEVKSEEDFLLKSGDDKDQG